MKKLCGSILVLTAVLIGWRAQRKETRRGDRLRRDLFCALQTMAEEVRTLRTPVPRLLSSAARCCGEEGASFFRAAAAEGDEALPAQWRSACLHLPLEETELHALCGVGNAFGGDEERFCSAAEFAAAQLQGRYEERMARRSDEEKRSAALWFSGGILAVIMLI